MRQRQPASLALDVPEGDVDRGERKREQAAGTARRRGGPQPGDDRLDAQRVVAERKRRERIDRGAQLPRERAAESGQPDALDSGIGAQAQRDEVARGAGEGRAAGEGLVGGQPDDAGVNVGELHRCIMLHG